MFTDGCDLSCNDDDSDNKCDNCAKTVYHIIFYIQGDETELIVPEGETPVFEGSTDIPMTESTVFTFEGWNNELAPATEDKTYVAQYKKTARKYNVEFRVDGETIKTIQTPYGNKPLYIGALPTKEGLQFAFWEGADNPVSGDMVCEAVFLTMPKEYVLWALDQDLIAYQKNYENTGDINTTSPAFLYLAIAEHEAPGSAIIRERLLAHLRSITTGGNEPGFTAGPFWSYSSVALGIAVCRMTPSVWDELTPNEKARLDLIMECFAISTAFVSDDDNTYKTGPSLTGNHGKSWNPNHRMAMTTPIVASVIYFSAGADNKVGADYINNMLVNFDHDAYIAKFNEYGFTRAKYNWTTPGIELPDGSMAKGAKELMMEGGPAYLCREDSGSTSNGLVLGESLGTGKGIRGNEFTYFGIALEDIAGIMEHMYKYNFSGGVVTSDSSAMKGGLDADNNPLAYIVGGLKSPVEGELGMMLEFNGGDGGGIRSSGFYVLHDFLLVVSSMAALDTLDIYTPDIDGDLFRKIWVGNTDAIFKLEVGYNSYSIGKDRGVAKETDTHMPWKAWWNENYGDAIAITKEIKTTYNGGTAVDMPKNYPVSEEAQSIALPTPTHVVGTFAGWYLDAAGKITELDGVKISGGKLEIPANYNGVIKIYAIFDIPDNIPRASVKYHVDGMTFEDGVYYDIGEAVSLELPTIDKAGFVFSGWYTTPDFTGTPLFETLELSEEEAKLCKDINLYGRCYKEIWEQTDETETLPGEMATNNTDALDGSVQYPKSVWLNGKLDFSLIQVKNADGSISLIKRVSDDPAYKSGDGAYRYVGLSNELGVFTIEMTLYNNTVTSAIRLRASANTADFLKISSDGKVTLLSEKIATLTNEPTTFAFIVKGRDGSDGFDIDAYVNGVLVAENLPYNIALTAETATTLHWYFGSSASGSVDIKNFRIADGFDIKYCIVCEHEDTDANGVCDKCLNTISCEHKDDNADGKCDKCDYVIPCEHEDKENDNKCDKCGEFIIPPACEHIDVNADGKCDTCDEVYYRQIWEQTDGAETLVGDMQTNNTDALDGSVQYPKSVWLNGKLDFSLIQVKNADGSISLIKRVSDDPTYKSGDGAYRFTGITSEYGAYTIEMTLYNSTGSSGMRIRSTSKNTSNFLEIADGTVKLGTQEIATLSNEPTTLALVVRDNKDADGLYIDAYVNGELKVEKYEYQEKLTLADATVLHWYFYANSAFTVNVKNFRVVDGVNIKYCVACVHEDLNNDGKCDNCGAAVTPPACEHIDANDDGSCDKCEAAFSDGCDAPCVDEDEDGKCDNCGEAVTPPACEHIDVNDDMVCDSCGDKYYTVIAAQTSESEQLPCEIQVAKDNSKNVCIDGTWVPSLIQTKNADGTITLTKRVGNTAGETNGDGAYRYTKISCATGAITLEFTLSDISVASAIRLRSGTNTGNFLSIGTDGKVQLLGTKIATVTSETAFAFVFKAGADGKNLVIDAYVNGTLVLEGGAYSVNDMTIGEITTMHWYFGTTSEGSMNIKNLRIVDGENIKYCVAP